MLGMNSRPFCFLKGSFNRPCRVCGAAAVRWLAVATLGLASALRIAEKGRFIRRTGPHNPSDSELTGSLTLQFFRVGGYGRRSMSVKAAIDRIVLSRRPRFTGIHFRATFFLLLRIE